MVIDEEDGDDEGSDTKVGNLRSVGEISGCPIESTIPGKVEKKMVNLSPLEEGGRSALESNTRNLNRGLGCQMNVSVERKSFEFGLLEESRIPEGVAW